MPEPALARRLEVSGGGGVVDCEGQVALAPAVLSYTTELLPAGSLLVRPFVFFYAL